MLPFVIERLIISGLGKTDSVIEFSDGLTFVVGPSNTGKSHVMDGIDYLSASVNLPPTPSGLRKIGVTINSRSL